jgi:hypothetical protein
MLKEPVAELRVLVGVTTGEQLHGFLDKGWQILKGCDGQHNARGEGGWWLWYGDEQAARAEYAERQAHIQEQAKYYWKNYYD